MRDKARLIPSLLSHNFINKGIMFNMKKSNYTLEEIATLLQMIITLLKDIEEAQTHSGIYTQKELLSILSISPNTLKSWENIGLRRLEPPIEGTRTVFYKIADVLEFLNNN